MQRRQLPHLDVRSDFLVYVTNVPSTLTGKELKSRINAQYGLVKFIETFEAWARRRIGCIVIEFTTFDGSDAFMRAAIERRIPYLNDVGVQHVGIVGRRHFFELIHRDTDIDLLDCNGQPYNTNWLRARRDRSQRSKPYNRESKPFNRAPKPKKNFDENGEVTNVQVPAMRTQRHNSPSSDESVGPFPSSSGVLRKLVQFSVWQSKTTGRTHILTFDSSNKGKINSTPSIGENINNSLERRSRIDGKTSNVNKKFNQNLNHNQIISERLDRLREKYNKEASNKFIGEPGGVFIPLASKRRTSFVKPSAAVLPMKMAAEELEDGEIRDDENNLEEGELGEEPMVLCNDRYDDKKVLQKQNFRSSKMLVTKSPFKSISKKNTNKNDKWQKQKVSSQSNCKDDKNAKIEDKSPQKSQKDSNDSGSFSCADDGLDFDFPFELVEGTCSPNNNEPKTLADTNSSASMDLVSNSSDDKPKTKNDESDDGAIDDDILEGESIAGDIDERWLDDNYADRLSNAECDKPQSESISEPSFKSTTIDGIFNGEGSTHQRCSSSATTTTGLEHSILRMSIGRKREVTTFLNRQSI